MVLLCSVRYWIYISAATTMSSTKILIADAQTLRREGIKAILLKREDLEIIGVAKNEQELSKQLQFEVPDVVVLSFQEDGNFDLEQIAQIKSNYPHIRLIILSSLLSNEKLMDVLAYEVDAFLLNECDEDEFLNAVKAVKKDEKFYCGHVMGALLHKVIRKDEVEEELLNSSTLSEREIEIIQLIADGFTTKDIAQQLYLSFHTVGTHRRNIFRKLNVRNSSELIIHSLRKGIITAKAN
ncbi:response regulator transcription factor [Taibaiella lutea]|uniref:Response regulator transcription factor n=2 Tax=Taibaiella lutea TaxID=2608001 RepID=A0A5M6CLM7_9BACT|nr:response regulator transcription factor [Taibaiella lutea]